jgi:protein RecA
MKKKKEDSPTEDKKVAKKDSISTLIADLNKAYGKEVIGFASENPDTVKIPTRNPAFDYVSGGGVPVNRIIEFAGNESSTKTLHAIWAAIEFQLTDWETITPKSIKQVKYLKEKISNKDGTSTVVNTIKEIVPSISGTSPIAKRVAYVDTEGTFDKKWAEYQGLDLQGLIYMCPDKLSQAVDVAEALLSDEDICLVIFDSLSAMGADAEMDASMENEQMALNARFWNKAVRKFQAAINRNPNNVVTLICINTIYSKVGVMFGNPEETKNGTGLKFAKSLSMRFNALKEIKDTKTGECVGRNFSIRNLKNKTSRPFLNSEFYLSYVNTEYVKAGHLDYANSILSLAQQYGIIERAGAWFTYEKIRVQGFESLKDSIESVPGLLEEIAEKVYLQF